MAAGTVKIGRSFSTFSRQWFHLVSVNLIVLGIELCASAGFTYIPPLMLKSGFAESSMTLTMGIGPLATLLLVPGIGRWSDNHRGPLGRRIPFILALSALLLVSLFVLPFASIIGGGGLTATCVMVAIGVFLLDFSTQALLNPCKALVSDLLLDYQCPEQGFAMYSCMMNLGSCMGYFVTSLDWGSTSLGRLLGNQEKVVFPMMGIAYLVFLALTLSIMIGRMKRIKDEAPITMEETYIVLNPKVNQLTVNNNNSGEAIKKVPVNMFKRLTIAIKSSCLTVIFKKIWRRLADFASTLKSFGNLPNKLRALFWADAFAWMAMHCHDSYYTDFMGKVVYGGQPTGSTDNYDRGVRMGSWGLLLQSISATLYAAFIQDRLVSLYGQKSALLFGLSSFTCCMIGMLVTSDVTVMNLLSLVSGIGFASLTTIPYDVLTGYHHQKHRQIDQNDDSECRGVGEDMAVLDSASSLSQVLPSLFLGWLVGYYGSSSMYIIFSAVCGLIACYFALFVTYTDGGGVKQTIS